MYIYWTRWHSTINGFDPDNYVYSLDCAAVFRRRYARQARRVIGEYPIISDWREPLRAYGVKKETSEWIS